MEEPGIIVAGECYSWERTLLDYPAGEWLLHYIFLSAGGAYYLTALAEGDKHRVNVPPDDTGAWLPGRYDWTAYVTNKQGGKHVIDTGVTKIVDARQRQKISGALSNNNILVNYMANHP